MPTDFSRLRAIPLFASLKDDELAYIGTIIKQTTYPANEIIIRQGELGETFYIIISGQVRVRRRDDSGAEAVTRRLGPGQYFGEVSLLYGEPRSATVETVVNTTLLYITKDDFDAMVARLPAVRKQFEETVGRRSRQIGLSRFDWRSPDEMVLWIAQRHVIPLFLESLGSLLFWHLLAAALAWVSFAELPRIGVLPERWQWTLRFIAFITVSLVWVWYIVGWTNDYIALTNRRIVYVKRHGVLGETRVEIPIEAIQNVTLCRGPLDALLRLRSIIIETADQVLTFSYIPAAQSLRDRIFDQLANVEDFDLSKYRKIYYALLRFPNAEVTSRLFEMLNTLLSYNNLSDLAGAAYAVSRLTQGGAGIGSQMIATLAQLGNVSAEIATYQAATSHANRFASLARATSMLDNLDRYVTDEVTPPNRAILRRICRQWQHIISETGAQMGFNKESGPVANPYVVGNPVTGNIFVGRGDVLRRLEELWAKEGQCPSVVLYGHRRMGKSSILQNLGVRFGANTVIVDFNLQRVGLVSNTGELLYNLASALYDSLPSAGGRGLARPREDEFAGHNPYSAFDGFLRQLDRVRARRRFIIAVDEFELIEQMVTESKLEAHLLDFWRGLIQTYPWFVMAFAGLHTLQEMTQDYWHPLFGSVTAIPVSFLGHDAAWRLITDPSPDFSLDYDADAVERIIALTHGQPYLTQLICHGLVTRFNRQTFEQSVERERRFSLSDVEAVISAPEFFRDGNAYFTGVWVQADKSEPLGQTIVLRALAQSEMGMTIEEITQANLAPENVQHTLEALARHDVVMQENDRWKFTVELMRRWVAQRP